MHGMSNIKIVEKIITHLFNKFFPQKLVLFLRDNLEKIWYSQTGHRGQCTMDNKGYRHALRICNVFPQQRVTWMRFSVVFIHTLPVLLHISLVYCNCCSVLIAADFQQIMRFLYVHCCEFCDEKCCDMF
jgi:hypothetical protein